MRELIQSLREATGLPEDPWAYFKKTPGVQLLPISKLRVAKAPKDPKERERAKGYMALARKGKGAKRGPILVRKGEDGTYTILDGNATASVAKRSGWKKIPAKIVSD